MSKHTKGPWAINEFLVYAENGNGCTLATINSTSKGISDEEAQANARLIAAAPELLEACQSSLQWILDVLQAEPPETYSDDILDELNAAIDKATGE